jgi:hypothetical protein
MKKSLTILAFALLLSPASLIAQEQDEPKYRFGLTFPEIGVIWHISDNIAFVPGIEFGHGWSSSTISFDDSTINSSSNTLKVNAGLRFYISEWKDLRFYLSRRTIGFSRRQCVSDQPRSTPVPLY